MRLNHKELWLLDDMFKQSLDQQLLAHAMRQECMKEYIQESVTLDSGGITAKTALTI